GQLQLAWSSPEWVGQQPHSGRAPVAILTPMGSFGAQQAFTGGTPRVSNAPKAVALSNVLRRPGATAPGEQCVEQVAKPSLGNPDVGLGQRSKIRPGGSLDDLVGAHKQPFRHGEA